MKLNYLLLFALISITTFSACSDNDNNPIEEPEVLELTAIRPMETDWDNNGDNIPMSWDSFGWNYEEGKLVSYTSEFHSNVKTAIITEYTNEILESYGTYKTEYETEFVLNSVTLENGLVKNKKCTSGTDLRFFYSIDFDYYYNTEGYLESVTGVEKNGYVTEDVEMQITRVDGNITQIKRVGSRTTTVYTYTYDDKEYIPMSDFSAYTPLAIYAPYPLIEFYSKLGKQNKNNIKEVNIEYIGGSQSYNITKLTYETVLNEDGTIKQINHTGVYLPHFSEPIQTPLTFTGLRTVFEYTPTKK